MNRHSPALRFLAAAPIVLAIAITAILFGSAGAASAATPTNIALASITTSPAAGSSVIIQAYVISTDGTTPAGTVTMSVEGSGMSESAGVDTSTHEAQIKVGAFPIGNIVVDGYFTPSSASYAPGTTHSTVTIVALPTLTIAPVIIGTPTVGTPVTVSTIIEPGGTFAPGGVVTFVVSGVNVATCTPKPTGAIANWSCSATLPAPKSGGTYSVTAVFSGSSYYANSSGTGSKTIAAASSTSTSTSKSAAAPAPIITASPSATVTPPATPSANPTAVAVADGAVTVDAKSSVSGALDPWALLFIGLVALVIAAAVAALFVIHRRRIAAPGAPHETS